jgi:hypothetical protein
MDKNAAVPVRNLGVMGTVSSCYGGAGCNSGLSTAARIAGWPAESRRPSCTNIPKFVWSPQRVGILLTKRFFGSRRSSKTEQRFCKPACTKRHLLIFNGYKGFLIVSLGDVGWLEVSEKPSRAQRRVQIPARMSYATISPSRALHLS